jgi:hypothetical protein
LLPTWVPFASRADPYEPNDVISEASGEVSSHDSEVTAFGGRPGQVPLVAKTDTPVRVSAPQTEHDRWEELLVYLEQYANETHQAIRRSHTVGVDVRNKEISQTAAAKNGVCQISPTPLERRPTALEDGLRNCLFDRYVPVRWKTYKRVPICTHGWKPRRRAKKGSTKKKKGKDARDIHFLRGVICPFKTIATVTYRAKKGKWVILLDNKCLMHNHDVAPEVFKTLAENRDIKDPVNEAKARSMAENKRKPKAILQEMLARGETLTLRDAQNMVQAYKNEVKLEDDDAACLAELSLFTAEDERNLVSVDETSQNETGVISLTSASMSGMASRFGEMLLVDCTHKTNRFVHLAPICCPVAAHLATYLCVACRYNYQLMTMMIVDDYGEGQVVQHSLLERNADWHMPKALDHFVRANTDVAKKISVIMVDKDLNEIKVLQTYFPHARNLICTFHVLKYLAKMVRKPDYGKISVDDRDALNACIHGMVYADSKEKYDDNHKTLVDLCEAIGYTKFYEYFSDSCIEIWVLYRRSKLPHFRVHTNNHLESFFGMLKGAVTAAMGMTDTLGALIKDDHARENEYTIRRTRVGQYFSTAYDDDMNALLKFMNPFVARSVEGEYKLALAKADVFAYGETSKPGVAIVRGQTKTHEVDLRTWLWSCSFSHSMKLPCQHTIALRKLKLFEVAVPLKAVDNGYVPLLSISCPFGVHSVSI